MTSRFQSAKLEKIDIEARAIARRVRSKMDLNNASAFHLEARIFGRPRVSESRQFDIVQTIAGREFDFLLTRECLCLFKK